MSGGVLLLVVIAFALIWLFLIRPQRRRQTAQLTMQETLEIGDEIVTAGGVYGTVTALDEDEVGVEIADGVVVRVARRAVAGVIPPPDEDEEDETGGDGDAEADAQGPDEPEIEPRREAENASRS